MLAAPDDVADPHQQPRRVRVTADNAVAVIDSTSPGVAMFMATPPD
jgi:hypothetical protein